MKIYSYETKSGLVHTDLQRELSKYTDVELVIAPERLLLKLQQWNGIDCLTSLVCEDLSPEDCRILIVCENESIFYQWIINQCSHALWGGSNTFISVDYASQENRLYNQLHECLHFLEVDDCYEGDIATHPPKSTCDNENCVMRYGKASTTVCSNVLNQVENWANE